MQAFRRIHPPDLPVNALPQAGPGLSAHAARHALFSAIMHAPKHDLLALLKSALAAGASLQDRFVNDADVFTTAVCHDRPHAIGLLLALGAQLPYADAHGIDLLMHAAMLDHDECCSELINNAGLHLSYCDSQGRNALFHAVQSGSVASARVMLQAGADPNQSTDRLHPESLSKLLGRDHRIDGLEVTPLMVATARGDGVLVDVLIDSGARPDDGDFPPLHIAAEKHDEDMIARLLRHGAQVAASLDVETNCPLHAALASHAPLRCLRLLATHYPFAEDDVRDGNRPLLCAIRRHHADAVALFLGLGAQPCNDASDAASSWRIAADLGDDADGGAQILQLLATTRADRCAGAEIDADRVTMIFDGIVRCRHDPASLASHGLYPSLVQGLRSQLLTAPPDHDWQSVPQRALYAAALQLSVKEGDRIQAELPFGTGTPTGSGLAAPPSASSALPVDEACPGLKWRERTERGIAAQRSWLRRAAAHLVDANKVQLIRALTLDFFREMTDHCPDDVRLDDYIIEQLRSASGLPVSLISLLGKAWLHAARDARIWGGDAYSLEETEHFVEQRMLARAASDAELKHALVPNAMSATWLADLKQCALDKLALLRFARNPVEWLMRQEQRHDFRAVDTQAIKRALFCELGLPPAAGEAIAGAWEDAIRLLATINHGHQPQSWWRNAARMLSPIIAIILASDESRPLPRAVHDLTESWYAQTTDTALGTLSGAADAPAVRSALSDTSDAGTPPTPNLTSPSAAPPPPSSPPLQAPPRPQAGSRRHADDEELPRKKPRHQ